MTRTSKHLLLRPLLRNLRTPIAGMYAFRHYRVAALMESNVPLEAIKTWIGHGSEAMTRSYSHLQPRYFEKHVAAVPDVLAGIAPKSPWKTGDWQRKLLITSMRP